MVGLTSDGRVQNVLMTEWNLVSFRTFCSVCMCAVQACALLHMHTLCVAVGVAGVALEWG